ncbi:MAG: DUF3800 domain-containing protein [Roseimicrobium sp.]
MDIEVYCDESQTDILTTQKSEAKYLVIGSLWLEKGQRETLKQAVNALADQHRVGGEFKWGKLSPSRAAFYQALQGWFFAVGLELRFRCIVVPKKDVDLVKFHQSDAELGFYKFYYQLLHHWIDDFNDYQIFCDYKRDRVPDRLHTLQRCLDNSNLTASVKTLQWVRSEESVLIQAVDVLTGAVSAKLNGTLREGTAKAAFVAELERRLGRNICHTRSGEKKFNIFQIQLGGRWGDA